MNKTPSAPGTDPDAADVLNAQTARISWPELARHFARGRLLVLANGQDLTAVAAKMVRDEAGEFEQHLSRNQVRFASDHDAIDWQSRQPEFWAVVVAPWVMIQEVLRPDLEMNE
jgi:hypothetical protein